MGRSRNGVCTCWSVYDKALCGNMTWGKVPLWVCHGQCKEWKWGREEKRGRDFPGLWDTVILIKSRRAEKESWEIKSVQHRRTHAAKHGKTTTEREITGWNQHHRVSIQTWTSFCPEILLRSRRSVAVLSVMPKPDYHLQLSAICLTLSKLQKTLQD